MAHWDQAHAALRTPAPFLTFLLLLRRQTEPLPPVTAAGWPWRTLPCCDKLLPAGFGTSPRSTGCKGRPGGCSWARRCPAPVPAPLSRGYLCPVSWPRAGSRLSRGAEAELLDGSEPTLRTGTHWCSPRDIPVFAMKRGFPIGKSKWLLFPSEAGGGTQAADTVLVPWAL